MKVKCTVTQYVVYTVTQLCSHSRPAGEPYYTQAS